MKKSKKKYLLALITLFLMVSMVSVTALSKNEEIFIKNGPRDKKKLAITFDDGPHPKETEQVLDVLKKHDVKATFFVAGKHVNWYTKPFIRASKEGHEIGNHTFNHPDISNMSPLEIENEILKCEEIITKITGKKPTLFRPPYGSYKESELSNIAKKHGYKVVLWTTVDTKDWKNPGASNIANAIINNAKNGDIILLHDYATNNTVEALDIFIPEMKKRGYEFVTVSELYN